MSPEHADRILRTIDIEALKVGAELGRGEHAERICRLIGPASKKSVMNISWMSDYMKVSSVQQCDGALEGHVLGIDSDDNAGTTHQFRKVSLSVHESRKHVKLVGNIVN